MLGRLRAALGIGGSANDRSQAAPPLAPHAPDTIEVQGAAFAFAAHLRWSEGLPHVDWSGVWPWVDAFGDRAVRNEAWALCERAWLAHLAQALGPAFLVRSEGDTLLLSSLDARAAHVVLEYVNRTRSRVLRVLEGIAADDEMGKDIVILFDDDEGYYRYVSHHYPEAGAFALSGGMCIHDGGCVHFVSVKHEQHALEPVIAHETTHAMLAHLPLPLWLNEGLAVNTERRLSPPVAGPRHTDVGVHQMHRRHVEFWGCDEIQEFWSGASFGRPDQGNELSYDLARILVEQFAADWPRFVQFVNAAQRDDGGEAAARSCLGLALGDAVAAVLERESPADLAPHPDLWTSVRTEPA